MISAKILRRYKLLKYAAEKTGNDWRKLGKVDSKVLNAPRNRRGHEPEVYRTVVDFYHRDDVSTVLPGKWDSKSIPNRKGKRVKVQKRALNDYLSNLHEKLKAEKPHLKCSFTTFARMWPANFTLANFIDRRSCLSTQHQNLALKLKMLKRLNKTVSSSPDLFQKAFKTVEEVNNIFKDFEVWESTFEEWKKLPIAIKKKIWRRKDRSKDENHSTN